MLKFQDFLLEYETTLGYHDELNPALWYNNKLNSGVRKHLLKIAEVWRDFADIPEKAIKDIVMTGGNANFNYTPISDIDVHLIVDKEEITDCDPDYLDEYLKDKKTLWSLLHNIQVHGYDVELYAQDVSEPGSPDQGVYSLFKNEWIKTPKKEKVNYNDIFLIKKVKSLKHKIDHFVKTKSDNVEEIQKFKDKLKDMRSAAVRKGGEFSLENMAFKELRNSGYIDKLSDYITNLQDKQLSLKKGDSND
jgi:hypothetical protein